MMLSPEVIGWLDQVALPPDQQPDALVAHLIGALGVEREQVSAALAFGVVPAAMDGVVGVLSASATLTPLQRRYWLALQPPIR